MRIVGIPVWKPKPGYFNKIGFWFAVKMHQWGFKLLNRFANMTSMPLPQPKAETDQNGREVIRTLN